MKWSTVFVVAPVSASIAIRDGEPKLGAGVASVGAGITLSAMSFGAAVDVLVTPFTVTIAPCACANASAGVNVTPVPPAPAVPTVADRHRLGVRAGRVDRERVARRPCR